MKKIALLITVCLTAFVSFTGSHALAGEDSCTREDLTKITDMYFEAIQAHKTSDLPIASTAKFTENGVLKEVGKGFWETAEKPLLRRTLVDTQKCTTATIAVMEEPFSSKTIGSGMMAGGPGMAGGATANAENPTGSGLVDCHMFRMRDGEVDLIQSIVGPSAPSMGWPLEPIK